MTKGWQNSNDWLYWEMYKNYSEPIKDLSLSNIGVDISNRLSGEYQ